MKLIALILIFFSLAVQSQDQRTFIDSSYKNVKLHRMYRDSMVPETFVEKKLRWADWEIKASQKEKDTYLKKLVIKPFFPYLNPLVREEFHLIDFNGDGLNDIIFAGREPGGMEIDNFVFFENKGDSLYVTLVLLGTIIEINRDNEKSPIHFTVWEWPCCANQKHIIYYYTFYNGSDLIYRKNIKRDNSFYSYSKYQKNNCPNFHSNLSLTYIKSSLLPDYLNSDNPQPFVIKSDTAILQTNPTKEFEEKRMNEYIPEDYQKNIVIAKLLKNQQGEILNQMIYGPEVYYFVKVSIDDMITELEFREKKVSNILGWIKASDVDLMF